MAGNPNRLYDKTHLSVDQAEERGFIHRDYIAHCFRWSFVVKKLMQKHSFRDASIIDVGCGKDQPLPRLLYSNKMTGFDYCGIDMNKMDFHPAMVTAHNNGKVRYALLEETDASVLEQDDLPWGPADFLVAFEILEHIQPYIVARMLRRWKTMVKPRGKLFVSTPVFNGSAAANHINEMSWQTLGHAFEHHGFRVMGMYGTFASKTDLMTEMVPEHREVYHQLSEFYDSNVVSTFMAPLYPMSSRNILWYLSNEEPEVSTFDGVGSKNQNEDISDILSLDPPTLTAV